jgi:predicted nucleotide-binding protein
LQGEAAMSDDERISVLLVDDVEQDIRNYHRALNLTGTFDVAVARTTDEALKVAATKRFDVAVLDLVMPSGVLDDASTHFGDETGYQLAAKLVRVQPHIRIVILSHMKTRDTLDPGFREGLNISDMLVKGQTRQIDLVRSIDKIFGTSSFSPKVFIVHGHDRKLVEAVQDTVEAELGWTRPIVLDEQAGAALTIIEKFERYAQSADAVIVLMTPDDVGSTAASISGKQFRARQNVLFELGYFFGKFGRDGSRVLLLKSGDLEIPSDLSGVLYIDVTDLKVGLKTAISELRASFDPIGLVRKP